MCGAICLCAIFIFVTFSAISIGIGIYVLSYFGEYGLSFSLLFEKLKYWSIFSLEIFATFIGFCMLIGMLYELAKDILKLKENNKNQKDINIIKQNMKKILMNIILNLVVLSTFYYLYYKWNSEYYKTVMILYSSIILGFTASFPLLKDGYQINRQTEDILVFKSCVNTSLLFVSYLVYNFYLKNKF